MIGPVNHKKHYDRILGFIKSAKEEGAGLNGGGRLSHSNKGYYVEPVFTDEPLGTRTVTMKFSALLSSASWCWNDLDTVIKEANATQFGLTANIRTTISHSRIRRPRRFSQVWYGSTAPVAGWPVYHSGAIS